MRSPLVALLLVLSLAIGLRLIVHPRMAAEVDSFSPLIDSEAYVMQALRVARGEPIVEGVTFQAPLYAYLLGWTYAATGVRGEARAQRFAELPLSEQARALSVGRALQAALGVLGAVLAWWIGRRLFTPAAGLAAGLLAAAYGPLLAYEGHLLKVSLSGVLPLAAVLVAVFALERRSRGLWLACGLLLGAGGLVRGNLYLMAYAAAAALILAAWRKGTWRRGLAAAAALGLGVALALAPIVVRNSLVAGRPVVSTAAGGTAFWLCNHAGNSTGLIQHVPENRQVPRYELDDWRRLTEQELGRSVTPAEISSHWLNKALADIRLDPGRWLHVELRKLGLLMSRYEAPDNTSVRLAEEAVPILARLPGWGVVLPLALAGIAHACLRRRSAGLGALLLALLSYAASLLLFIVTARFRMPLCVLAIVPAGYGLSLLPSLFRAQSWGSREARVASAAFVGALAIGPWLGGLSFGGLGPLTDKELATHHVVRLANRAQAALTRGDEAAAQADLEQALELGAQLKTGSPTVFASLAALDRSAALVLADRGESAAAEQRLRQAEAGVRLALRASPDHLEALALQVLLALDRGREVEASSALSHYDRVAAEHGRSRLGEPPAFAILREKP